MLQDGSFSYVYGLGLISQTDGSGTQTYVLSNGLGSTERLTDGAGAVTATFKYDVFGAVRSSSGSATMAFTFTGQQQDAATGLLYLRARYYDVGAGRFISNDRFTGFQADPASQHRYAYVASNPCNWADPSGKTHQCPDPPEDIPPVPPIADISGNIRLAASWDSCNAPFEFAGRVRRNGDWDFRARMGGDQTYTDFGNFHYGAMGLAAGFDEETLLRMAGALQIIDQIQRLREGQPLAPVESWPLGGPPFGDRAIDHEMIKRGFQYFHWYKCWYGLSIRKSIWRPYSPTENS